VVTNSYHQRVALAKKYPWLRDRLSTIYNGYDLDYFIPATVLLNNYPLHILVISHVSPYKNGLCLVEALHLLRQHDNLLPQVDWIGQQVMKGPIGISE
jgi:glycosyltransferase involved in cell wall biosynthesis